MTNQVLLDRANECSKWNTVVSLLARLSPQLDAIRIPRSMTVSDAQETLKRTDDFLNVLEEEIPAVLLHRFRYQMSCVREYLRAVAESHPAISGQDERARTDLTEARKSWERFQSFCTERASTLSNFD